jgi:hypothetical protein
MSMSFKMTITFIIIILFISHFYIFYMECNNFIQMYDKSEECLHHAAVVWIQLSNLEQSALFWHQVVGYSVGKIDVFQKENW